MADVASRVPNTPKKRTPSVANTAQSLQKKSPEVPKSVVADTKSQAPESELEHATNGGEFETITNEDAEEGEEEEGEEEEEEDDDGTEEAVPAGNVDKDGNVVDEAGNIIGHVSGKASDFEGSIVDQEGDILDQEGNVVGKADLLEVKSHISEAASKGDEPMKEVDPQPEEALSEKPELAAPFGVQDNGEITNATGDVVGKLSEGTPQDLVGTSIKDIDPEGKLLNENGSVLGKADIEPQLLQGSEKLGESLPGDKTEVGSQLPEHELKEGSELPDHEKLESGSHIPEGSQVGEKPEGTSVAGSKLSKAEKLEGTSVAGSKLSKDEKPELDSEGNPIEVSEGSKLDAEEPKLDAEGHELPKEPELDSEGNPIEQPEEPKLDAEGKPIEVAEPKLDEEGKPIEDLEEPKLDEEGKPIEVEEPKLDKEGNPIPEEPKLDAEGKEIPSEPKLDEEGNPIPQDIPLDAEGNPIPESEREKLDEGVALPEGETEKPDLSVLKGKKVNKAGKIVDENGTPFGQLVEGDAKKLIGKKVDAEGNIWNDSGKIIGRAELLPEEDREAEASGPFEDFPDSVLDKNGNVIFEGKVVGKLIEGEAKKLEGKKVDADGDVVDKNGNVLGKAERYQEEDAVPEPEPEVEVEDLSLLEGKKVNKLGNVVDHTGQLFGRIVSGDVSKLVGKICDAEGKIWGASGKVIGTAELIPAEDREAAEEGEFVDFPDAIVDRNGNILYEGQIVGKLVEGDAKKLVGKKIDKDGEIVDKIGNILGRAERWIEEDAPEPEKVDMSALAGKRVNKAGNVVDSHGDIYGRLVEGDPKALAGRMCDKNGHVFSEGGNIVGRAELVPESERAGQKEGPFAGFSSPTVAKDGKVADSKGEIIGRLIEGDAKKLYGKEVDPDGDVLDKNGNTLGKAERWEEPEEEVKEVKHSVVFGRKVNKEGNVVDENGDLIAKLTEGTAMKCAGKEIDDDGDVYNSKGAVIGHVTLIEDIPEPEVIPEPEPEPEPEVEEEPEETETETETEEEKTARLQKEQDRRLAGQMAQCIQGSLDNIAPVLKMITDAIDAAERQPKEELDEQKLVDTVKPLIEQGHQILMEANGVIRGLDPDGSIAAGAKGRAGSKDASPEEYRLAEVLKELTGNVTQTIENAKKKISGMPHAKKELNPLWNLLAEPLGQILAAVGLLLAGVLGLVGRLLSGLGLGGLLDNLLGGLGLKGILKGLGLGMVTESLTGRK